MTAPDPVPAQPAPDGGGDVQAALAELDTLRAHVPHEVKQGSLFVVCSCGWSGTLYPEHLRAALAPVVARLCEQRAAEALREAVGDHDIVVELYDGIALSMKCISCRVRIPTRPERAAAQLPELNYLAQQHRANALDARGGAR